MVLIRSVASQPAGCPCQSQFDWHPIMDRVARTLEVWFEAVWNIVKVPVMDRPLHCVHANEISFRLHSSDCLVARVHSSKVCGLKTVLSQHQLFRAFIHCQLYERQQWLWEEHTCAV